MTRRRLAAAGSALMLLLVLGGIAAGYLVQRGPVVRVVTLGNGEHTGSMVVDDRSRHAFLSLYNDRPNVNQILMLDTATGAPLRTIALPNQPTTLAVDASHGRLVVAGGIGSSWYLSILDTRGGKLLKTIPLLNPNFGAMVADEALGRVFATTSDGSGNGNLIVLDSTSGRLLRTLPVPGDPDADSLTIGGSPARLVVTSYLRTNAGSFSTATTASIVVFDPRTDRRLHARTIKLNQWGYINVDPADQRAYIFTTPSIFMPPVPLGRRQPSVNVNGGAIHIVDLSRDTAPRTIRLKQRPMDATVDTRTGRTFITVSGPVRVYTQFSRGSNGAFTSMSTSFVPLSHGSVLVLDSRSGRVVRREAVGVAPQGGVVIDGGRRVLIVNGGPTDGKGAPRGSASLSVLDGRSGAVLRTVSLGVTAYSIGITADDHMRHVFVLDPGGLSAVADAWGWVPGWLRHWLPFLPRPAPPHTTSGHILMLDAARL